MLILARSMVRNIQPSTFAWQRVAEHSACIKPQPDRVEMSGDGVEV